MKISHTQQQSNIHMNYSVTTFASGKVFVTIDEYYYVVCRVLGWIVFLFVCFFVCKIIYLRFLTQIAIIIPKRRNTKDGLTTQLRNLTSTFNWSDDFFWRQNFRLARVFTSSVNVRIQVLLFVINSTEMGKLNVVVLRYLSRDDFRVLTAVSSEYVAKLRVTTAVSLCYASFGHSITYYTRI